MNKKIAKFSQKIKNKLNNIVIYTLVLVFVVLSGATVSGDLRSERLRAFLYRYPGTPLISHINEILYCADKFKLDWRLYVAIAGAESTFGKHYPKHTRNLTGFNNCDTKFRSIYDNIYRTHEVIATTKYYAKYRKTKNIKDLVYVYKGKPPYEHYIKTIKFVFWKINDPNLLAESPGGILFAEK
ncbi:MAG: hypothetical protein WC527_02325 [Candidatus Margulisiibacteriota bacterium]